jgi:type IV pilus assembly protein PilB
VLRAKTMKLGEMLKEAGLIDDLQLKSALSYQRNCGGRLGTALIALKYISEETLLDFLAEQLKLTRVDLSQRRLAEEVVRSLPEAKARQYNVIPVARKEHGGAVYLLVAMSDPTNLGLIDELQAASGCRIRPALETEQSIREAIDKAYSTLGDEDESSLAEALDQILLGGERTSRQVVAEGSPSRGTAPADRLQRLIDLLARKGLLSEDEVRRLR